MKKNLLLLVAALYCFTAFAQEKLTVAVHPGVELFTIVQILANKYPEPNPSIYSKEVLAYFEPYKNHPAVKKVISFEKTYTDLVELGWCFYDFPKMKMYEPADLSWYKYYGKENVLEYMRLCKDFFNDTHFWDFYNEHLPRYNKWAEDLKAQVDSGKLISKLQDFYGYNSDVKWYICIDPLNSWGSHAIMTKTLNPQFGDWIVYNTGYFKERASSTTDPVFEFKDFENLVWHEGSHVFISPLMKKYKTEINELAYLFNKDDEGMKRNRIATWEYCFDETVVRSVTASLYKKYRSPHAYRRQVARETAIDFIYVEDLSRFIYDNYIQTHKYKDFAEFFPEIIRFMKTMPKPAA